MTQRNKNQTLLFDVSPFLYMAYYGATYILNNQADLNNENKLANVAENVLVGKIQACFNLVESENLLPIFCYDGRHNIAKKKQINQNYKEGRSHPITKYIRERLMSTFKLFPGYHLINDNEEADDLIATLKSKVKSHLDCDFHIFSKDNDLLQLCDYRTFFYDPAVNKGTRDREYLKEKFNGIDNFKQIILHKVCFGDSSDNIEGIFKGRRRKVIVDYLKKCLTFRDFLNTDLIDSDELIQKAIDNYRIIKLKENLSYTGTFNSDISILDFNPNLIKLDNIL